MEKIFRYNVIFRAEPEDGFTAIVPSLPGCVTYGRDLKEARKMAIDAIRGYVASLKKHKESIPTNEDTFFSSVEVKKTPIYA